MKNRKKWLIGMALLVAAMASSFTAAAGEKETPRSKAGLQVDIGFDSEGRQFYHPTFRFDFPLASSWFFTEVGYLKRFDSHLKGPIDYWVAVGLKKAFSDSFALEVRANHMCRHQLGLANVFFNLNEIVGKVWLGDERLRLGLGGGFYVYGNDPYKNLLTVDLEARNMFGSPLFLRSEVKWIDSSFWLHETELGFSFSRHVDIFVMNASHYVFPVTTYLGLRLRPGEQVQPPLRLSGIYLHCGIYPSDDRYKLDARGGYILDLIGTSKGRLRAEVDFRAPILAAERFFGFFFPDYMFYDIRMEYQRRLGSGLCLGIYGRCSIDLAVDKAQPFSSDLAAGLALRNQDDFRLLDRRVRWEVAIGLNSEHRYEIDARLGLQAWRGRSFNLGLECSWHRNDQEERLETRFFLASGSRFSFRPFVGLESSRGTPHPDRRENRFVVGWALYRFL